MKALVYHGPGKKSWEDVPDAAVQEPTDVVVTRRHHHHLRHGPAHPAGDVPAVTDGRILGHEAVGVVTEVGDAVTSFKVGDRVLVPAITRCGRCEYCQRNMPSHCQTVGGIGWIFGHLIDGTQAEAVRVPYADTSLYLLPDGRAGRAGHLPGRLPPHRLRGGGPRGRGASGRHRRRRRGRCRRPLRRAHHRALGCRRG